MKTNSILREYKSGNKWVRIGVWLFTLGLVPFIASVCGMFYLWLTDFPMLGVPIPSWVMACMLFGLLYMVIGIFCVAFGMEPPGGGGRRKHNKSNSTMFIDAQTA